MSYNFFCHNYLPVTRLACLPYSCSNVSSTYGSSWSTFLSDAGTFAFPSPDNFTLSPSDFTGNVWEAGTLPVGKNPPLDVCDADSNRRYFRQKDTVGATTPIVTRDDNLVADQTFRTIIGPYDQTIGGTLSSDDNMKTTFRFKYYTTRSGVTNQQINVNVSLELLDEDTDNVWDAVRITVVINGSCSYRTLPGESSDLANALTAAEYQTWWDSYPGSGSFAEQYTNPTWTLTVPIGDIFPDSNFLWTPMQIEVDGADGIIFQRLTGAGGAFSDRDSWWAHISCNVKIGDYELDADMNGDLYISDSGTYPTTPWPTTPPDSLASNEYFWAANSTNNRIAIGGIGDQDMGGTWEDFKLALERNRSSYTPPEDC